MIIKGRSRGGTAASLAAHLGNVETNEVAELWEVRGVAATDLEGALAEMDAVGSGARTTKPFYHAAINWREHETLTEAQKAHAVDALEHELGFDGQPRAVVQHVKDGRAHLHVVWSRIDIERMAAISDSHNFRKHEDVARQLERDFGHERTQGAHSERDGVDRPERTPSHAEMMQSARSGVSPREMKAELTELWHGTTSGQAFQAGIEERGYLLTKGDRRDFVVLDQEGETHSLARRIEGAKAADIRARMADVDRDALPSVDDGKVIQFNRAADKVMEAEPAVEPVAEAATAAPEASVGAADDFVPAGHGDPGRVADRGIMVAGDAMGKGAEKLSDFVSNLADAFFVPPPPKKSAFELATDPAARREQYAREGGERRSREAVESIRDHQERGKALRPEDIQALTPDHLINLRAKGDAYVNEMIRMHEKEQAKGIGRNLDRD